MVSGILQKFKSLSIWDELLSGISFPIKDKIFNFQWSLTMFLNSFHVKNLSFILSGIFIHYQACHNKCNYWNDDFVTFLMVCAFILWNWVRNRWVLCVCVKFFLLKYKVMFTQSIHLIFTMWILYPCFLSALRSISSSSILSGESQSTIQTPVVPAEEEHQI